MSSIPSYRHLLHSVGHHASVLHGWESGATDSQSQEWNMHAVMCYGGASTLGPCSQPVCFA